MSTIDWSKAPEGATHALLRSDRAVFFRQDIEAFEWVAGEWHHVGPDLGELKCERDLIERPAAPIFAPQNDESQNVARVQWDGEGLPPVGVECEVTPHNNVWGFSTLETRPCSVIAYHADFAWIDLGLPGVPVATRIDKVDFTPIRTPEQIAQQERLAAIEEMDAVFSSSFEGHRKDGLQALYDAGYRKP